jgi:hypothetical protein
MKKVTFLLTTLLIGGMMLTGCKKAPQPTPEPESKTAKVTYKLDNVGLMQTGSNCFKYTVSYLGADGKLVTVNNVTLPWTSPEVTVKLPFTAKIEGDAIYNEAELPSTVSYGCIYYLYMNGIEFQHEGEIYTASKDEFISIMAENPNTLKFNYSKTLVPN